MSKYHFKRSYLTARKDVSGLIRMALHDLEVVEKDPRYFIDIESMYHRPIEYVCAPSSDECGTLPTYKEVRCGVCLAGATMVRRFDSEPAEDLEPDEYLFTPLVNRQLLALDAFREGNALRGWHFLFNTDENPWDSFSYGLYTFDVYGGPTLSEPYPLRQDFYVVPSYTDSSAGFKRALHAMADRFEKAGY